MLSVEENEMLTHVGPGTIMGDLLRQYWVPALLSTELPSPDCAPVRVRLMCENLIAFRTTSGKVGLIQDACSHRAASLFFGRNEEEGIRCIYHGWKFDITGQCLDMLSEPPESSFPGKVKATAYPCVERGGLVWTYMGTRSADNLPPLPDLEPNMMPEGQGTVRVNMFEWNWFQCMENNMDTAHQGILHFGAVPYEDAIVPEAAQKAYPGPVEDLKYIVANRAPRFHVRDTEFGCSYAAYRPAEETSNYYRTMHWAFPWVTMTPVIKLGSTANCVITVPIDDTHHWKYSWTHSRTSPLDPSEARGYVTNSDLNPDYTLKRNKANRYLQDREEMKTSSFLGMGMNFNVHDAFATEGQGDVLDRTQEHLGYSDKPIAMMRKVLLRAIRDLQAGQEPPHLIRDEADNHFPYLGGYTGLLGPSAEWQTVWKELAVYPS